MAPTLRQAASSDARGFSAPDPRSALAAALDLRIGAGRNAADPRNISVPGRRAGGHNAHVEGEIRWFSWQGALCGLILAAEIVLALARPIWWLSALATVAILIAYDRAIRRRVRPQPSERRTVSDHVPLPGSPAPSGPVYYPTPPRTEPLRASNRGWVLAAAAVILVLVAVLLFSASSTNFTPKPAGVLTVPLRDAERAVALPLSNYTVTVTFDGSANVWRVSAVTLAVKARPRRPENARIVRALRRVGWAPHGSQTEPDGSVSFVFTHAIAQTVTANTPSLTNWTPATTVVLGVPTAFPLGASSRVLVQAPSGLVGSTKPQPQSTSPVPGSNTEETVVPVDSYTQAVAITLNGWVQRHPTARSIAGFFAPILIPGGIGATLLGRLFKRKRKRKEQGADADTTTGTKKKPDTKQATTGALQAATRKNKTTGTKQTAKGKTKTTGAAGANQTAGEEQPDTKPTRRGRPAS